MTIRHVALFLLFGLASLASAQDVIRLKTGATLEGILIGETEDALTLQIPGGTMELRRSQVESVTRSTTSAEQESAQALLTLSRFQDHEVQHFLYQQGKRVGYRTLTLRREARGGIPGYLHIDRIVFAKSPGDPPELEVRTIEFVDAELRPREFSVTHSSGLSSRSAEGRVEGNQITISEHSGGRSRQFTSFLPPTAEFPGILLRRLAQELIPDGGYRPFTVFLPRDVDFVTWGVQRSAQRVPFRGKLKDVVVFALQQGERRIETWIDGSGQIFRQEIGTSNLVSQLAPREEVDAFVAGEEVPGTLDLGLEFVSHETGLRLVRPDISWDMVPGIPNQQTLVSFLHAGHRATVDVFRLSGLTEGSTVEGVAMKVLARMQDDSRELKVEGPMPSSIGDRKGLRFTARCMKENTELRTMGAVILHERDAFVILGASPSSTFDAAAPGFEEILTSFRCLEPERGLIPRDPFKSAEADLSR